MPSTTNRSSSRWLHAVIDRAPAVQELDSGLDEPPIVRSGIGSRDETMIGGRGTGFRIGGQSGEVPQPEAATVTKTGFTALERRSMSTFR